MIANIPTLCSEYSSCSSFYIYAKLCKASYLRTSYLDWINVPTLIVDCVSVVIAFIPKGLVIVLTASLTITANLMRKNKILCKSLKNGGNPQSYVSYPL
jgi:magnesium-transporting ATPase (P-type)